MDLKLPEVIADYINASNTHNVTAVLACFSSSATVRDQNQTISGKKLIKDWIANTIAKFESRFEPLRMREGDDETALLVNVTGNFPGSPVTLNYQFKIKSGKILSLSIM